MRVLASLWESAGEGIARATAAKATREKRANLTRENMTRRAKRKERLKAWGLNKTNAEGFYRVFQSEIIQRRLPTEESGRHEGRIKAGQDVDRARPEQVYRMRNMDMVSKQSTFPDRR
jgi:hypothetical protein